MHNTRPFDTALLKQRRARGLRGPDFLLQLAEEELLARLAQLRTEEQPPSPQQTTRPARVMVCGSDTLTRGATRLWPGARVLRGEWLATAEKADETTGTAPLLVLDHERLPFADDALDAMLVLFDFAFVNDLPKALMECRRVLAPGGMLLATLPGGESLSELRTAWMAAERDIAGSSTAATHLPGWRVAPFLDMRQLARLAGMAGLTHVVVDVERFELRYDDALSLMQELKKGGWSNPLRQRPRQPAMRALLARAAAHYELANTQSDGRISATLELLWLSARKPAPAIPSPA